MHTVDGTAHRVRKAGFLALLKDETGVAALTDHVALEWSRAVAGWGDGRPVVLFDETALILARSVCACTGIRLCSPRARPARWRGTARPGSTASPRPAPRHLRARAARAARARQEGALAALVRAAHEGEELAGDNGTAFEVLAWHRDADGRLLDPHTAAVELLNTIRPTVAIAWFAAFAAHALHRWPAHRALLRAEHDGRYARAFSREVRRFYPFAPFVAGLAATA